MPLSDALHGLAILVVVVIGSVVSGNFFRRVGQPAVLGPIIFGVVAGTGVAAAPESIRPALVSENAHYLLEAVGTAGLLLLMFSVGTELRCFRRSGEASRGWHLLPCAVLPIVVCVLASRPFAGFLGGRVAPDLYGWLFVGIALGVTAVPVLVLIIQDLGIGRLPISPAALSIAVVTDGLAWIMVTVLLVVTTDLSTVSIPALTAGLVLLATVVVVLPQIIARNGLFAEGNPRAVMMVVAALGGAISTQLLGFHPAIGAVIAGFWFPIQLDHKSPHHTFGKVVDVLLPAFFVSAAMAVPLQTLRDQLSWGGLWCVCVLAAAAFVSKLAVGFVFGFAQQWTPGSSARLGVLLNCRGVTEIAIAAVGFQAGLIGPFAFAALCGLAIVTTAATAPLFRMLSRDWIRAWLPITA